MKQQKILNITGIIVLGLVISFGANYAFAVWTNPPGNPPTCPDTIEGCNTPLNVSGTTQNKVGGLTLGGGIIVGTQNPVNGLIVQTGKVGIGTITPSNKLTINGGGLTGSGINNVLRLSGGAMSTVNDATSLLFIQWDVHNAYGAAIRLVNTQSTPQVLNPRLDFAVQNTGTSAQADIGVKMSILGNGNIGVGTINPTQKLEVVGTVKTTGLQVTGGTPGAGKVLTSDANGVGTWQISTGGSGGSSPKIISGVANIPISICLASGGVCTHDVTFPSGSFSLTPNVVITPKWVAFHANSEEASM
ncbi:MAG: hypothetical protein WCW03_00360 [Candidatus Paceibacterota bacterium]|jgi:hypothetical protein